MTTAVLITSTQDLAVALAVLRSGRIPTKTACLLVASTAVAAELDHRLLEATRLIATPDGIPVVHLNDIIFPRHPLGWRVADLGAEAVNAGWALAGGTGVIDKVAQVGRKKNPAVGTLRTVLGAGSAPIAYSPEHIAAAIRRRQRVVVVDAPLGFALLTRMLGWPVEVVPSRELAAARSALEAVDPEVQSVSWRTTVPRWWGRLVRSLLKRSRPSRRAKPASPRKAPKPSAAQHAQESIEFTHELIKRLDDQRAQKEPPTAP